MANTEKINPISGDGNGHVGETIRDALTSKELLVPAALSAVGAVAAAKAPDLVRRLTSGAEEKGEEQAKRLGEKTAQGAKEGLGGGGSSGVMGKVLSKAMPGGGGGGGGKKTRRLPIQRWTDVAVPVEKAYEAWTKFDQYPKFMHRVLTVEKRGNDKVSWHEKIWFSSRDWEGRITDRRKNDRIAWKTTSGMQHSGVVSFHRLDDNLTRVMVTMEFVPQGMVEKMASGMRFVKRAVQSDLARFKAHVEFEDAKGLEYSSARDDDQTDKDDKKDAGRSRNGGDPESERKERENRRRERREAVK